MLSRKFWLCLGIFWLVFGGAVQAATCPKSFDPRRDYFPAKVAPQYASAFSVVYHKNYKLVTVRNPWRGASKAFQYVLVQCGTPDPLGFKSEQIIHVPVPSIAALSTTHVAMLEKLGLLDFLIATNQPSLIYSPQVQRRLQSGKTKSVGQENAINVEALIDIQPALVTTFALGPDADDYPRLAKSGLKLVLNADYMETSPLGRSEWLKFMALFFNQEAQANQIFAGIVQRYESSSKLAQRAKTHPTVFTGFSIKGTWYIPGGKSYVAQFLKDAGAEYLWADNLETGSIPLGFEAIYERAASAKFWLPGNLNWRALRDLQVEDTRNGQFQAFKIGQVYNNNLRLNAAGSDDYWESGLVNPDLVLADLIRIFHPEVLPKHSLFYYRKL
ncbi:MAG: ABC transporter substrate-binding protein [Anaerolineae bacterium]|nr:ABC transporter substrate-binding protein [Gloeobacterales cyanobacterium ES-bin-313]